MTNPEQPTPAKLPTLQWRALADEKKTVDAVNKDGLNLGDVDLFILRTEHGFESLNKFLGDEHKDKISLKFPKLDNKMNAELKKLIRDDLEGKTEGELLLTIGNKEYVIPIDPENLKKLQSSLFDANFRTQTLLFDPTKTRATETKLAEEINEIYSEQLTLHGIKARTSQTR